MVIKKYSKKKYNTLRKNKKTLKGGKSTISCKPNEEIRDFCPEKVNVLRTLAKLIPNVTASSSALDMYVKNIYFQQIIVRKCEAKLLKFLLVDIKFCIFRNFAILVMLIFQINSTVY